MHPLLRGLFWFAVGYLVLVGIVWAAQGHLLYQPHAGRDHVATPNSYGLDYESVTLTTEDGLALDAWWVPHPEARATLLFFHGNAGNISHRLDSLRQFHELGLSVLILDYRGYGRSEGSPSEEGTALDARAGWQWLVDEQGVPPSQVIVFGRSLGSAVAAELARDVSPGAVVLESAFRSVPDMAQQVYPFLPARWLSRFEYRTADYVTEIDAPILVIHSKDDEIIPYDEGRAVYEAAPEPRQFLDIKGGHNTGFLDSEVEYLRGFDNFLREQGL